MGDKAEDVLHTLRLTEEQKKDYETVKDQFDTYFSKRSNTIFERARFNQRLQEEGESVDDFVTSLYRLVEHCDYGALAQEMIRDRIVVGIRDYKLSEQLQLDSELTLEKAISKVRQSEAVKQQQMIVRGPNRVENQTLENVDRVQRRSPSGRNPSYTAPMKRTQEWNECQRCGRKPPHARQRCPARDAQCHKCGRQGHFQYMCKTRQDLCDVTGDKEECIAFLENVTIGECSETEKQKAQRDAWKITLTADGVPVQFKIDTGADVTVMPEKLYKEKLSVKLKKSHKQLRGPNSQPPAEDNGPSRPEDEAIGAPKIDRDGKKRGRSEGKAEEKL
jgi:hypothetical protein